MIFRLSIILLFTSINCFSQTEKVKAFYNNGQLESVGKVLTYKTHEHKNLDCFSKMIIKKKGTWKYYNLIGKLIKIEKYKALINCDKESIATGKWQYWNDQGILYRQEIYENGIIYSSTIDIFKDTVLIGEIRIDKNKSDTVLTCKDDGLNLIMNPDFEIYKYKSVLLFNNGKSKIEECILFWNSPGDFTPDYYNPYRKIINNNIFSNDSSELNEFYAYVGLGLYQKNENYSEFIQGKLKKQLEPGQLYCFKLSLKLSEYSGFSIDKIGIFLSKSAFTLNKEDVDEYKPQITLDGLDSNNAEWQSICNTFTAAGNENYITIGEFEHSDNITIKKTEPDFESLFGLDQAAYYFLDKVELYQISSVSECNCHAIKDSSAVNTIANIESIDSMQFEDFQQLDTNRLIILNNVNFEFNKYELLPSSEKDLLKLLSFLNRNQLAKVEIIGHTDNSGSEEYNDELSENRAKAVYDWFVIRGILNERLSYKGCGKKKPLFDNTLEENRAKNRRVEFKLKTRIN